LPSFCGAFSWLRRLLRSERHQRNRSDEQPALHEALMTVTPAAEIYHADAENGPGPNGGAGLRDAERMTGHGCTNSIGLFSRPTGSFAVGKI
jgi:hypothetical protein